MAGRIFTVFVMVELHLGCALFFSFPFQPVLELPPRNGEYLLLRDVESWHASVAAGIQYL